jgi:hypothetical protein
MGIRTLDRDRYYAHVYGDVSEPPVKFYQDGLFFDGQGHAIDGSAAPEEKIHAAAEPVVVVEQPENDDGLDDMHIAKVKKLALKVEEATGVEAPPLKGKGLKKALIAYIRANTDE